MYFKNDYPYMGDIVKIELTDPQGFINNVFGADTLINLMQDGLNKGLLLGVMLIHEIMDYDTNEVVDQDEIYLLNEDNLIIHDTAFLAGDELAYIKYTSYDRPECANDFAKNISLHRIKSELKIRHVNGSVYSIQKNKDKLIVENINDNSDVKLFSLNNRQHMKRFYKEYKGFYNDLDDDSNIVQFKPPQRNKRTFRHNITTPEEIDKFIAAVAVLAAAGNKRLEKAAADADDASEKRSKFGSIDDNNS